MLKFNNIDLLWLVFCTALLIIMQAGFLMLETGLVRSKNSINVAIKNIFDLGLSVSIYWIIGFGLMFGTSYLGLFGTSFFLFQPSIQYINQSSGPLIFFLFQSLFCATASTIVSGAIAERIYWKFYSYIVIIVSFLIYPIFGHWAWGGILLGGEEGWLQKLGFIDFAGSTVVHSLGGWISLAVLLIIGPREGRFSQDKQVNELGSSSIPLAALGSIFLWFGWFGFNGGSNYTFDANVVFILMTTNIATIFSILSSYIMGKLLFRKADPRDMITGMLAGLVAISACCKYITIGSAVIIGILAGGFSIVGKFILVKRKIDDPVDAIPVHLIAGIWGTLSVAFFGERDLLGTRLSWGEQLWIQIVGIVVCAFWSFLLPYMIFWVINYFFRFRISSEEERQGLNITEHNVSTELYDFYRILNQDISDKEQEGMTEIGKLARAYKNRLERNLQTKTKSLRNFLTLTSQGFFSFGSTMQIEIGYSQECHRLFPKKDLENKNPADILFSSSIKRTDFSDSFRLYFEGKIQFDTLFKLLDNKISIQYPSGDTREIDIQYRVIEDNRIMCIITDESVKQALSMALSAEKEIQDRLLKAISESKYFRYLMKDAEELFTIFQEIIGIQELKKSDVEFLKSILLDVHDFKANLGFFGFDKTTRLSFEIESFLSEIIPEKDVDLERFKSLVQVTQNSFEDELKFFKEKLGDTWVEETDFLSIPISNIIEISETVKSRYPEDTMLIKNIEDMRKVPSERIFHRFIEVADKLAEKLGKKIKPISIIGGKVQLPVDIFQPLAKTLIHLIRNMLDHGIETPKERVQQGKDEFGNISIKIEEKKGNDVDYWIIYFFDDGRGINFEKIKQVAHDRGMLKKTASSSKSRLLKLLFAQDISTATEVSDISGRGVGLASVRQKIKQLGGDILVKTIENKETTFQIKIPMKN